MNNSTGTQPSNGPVQGSPQLMQWMEAVAGLARRLSLTTEPDEIIHQATRMVSEAFGIHVCAVLLYDERRQELICVPPAAGIDSTAAGTIRFSVQEGTLMRALWDRGEPWIVDELATDPRFERYRSLSQTLGLHSLILGSLRVGQARLGAFMWGNKWSGERFNQIDLFWFRTVADQISIALNHVQVVKLRMGQAKRSATLAQISGVLHATLSPREGMKAAVSMMLGAIGADRCHLFLRSETGLSPALSVMRANGEPWRTSDVDPDRAHWFREHWPQLDHDTITVIENTYFSPLIPSTWTTQLGIKSLILVPLWVMEELVGCMMVEVVEQVRHLDPAELEFIEAIATQCAQALKNARQYASLADQVRPLQETAVTYPPLVNAAGTAILVIQDDRYGFVAGAATEMLGYSPEEFLQMELIDLFAGVSQAGVRERYERLRKGQRVPSFEALAIARDGRELLLTLTGSVIEFEGAPAVLFIAANTTDLQANRDRLLQAGKLEAVTRLIGNLVGEVRNALTPVVGYTELTLELPGVTPELKENLEIIAHGAERVKKTFDRLATWAEIHPPSKMPVILNDMLDQMISFRQYEMQGFQIELVPDLDESLAGLATHVDLQQLQVAFSAIIDNAKDALVEIPRDRRLVIRTRRYPVGLWNPTEVIAVSFHDNGPGIAREHLLRVFDPFFTTKPPTQALGLGLWIAYQIVRNHGGEIYARSREGEGSTFVVELPVFANHTLPE